MKTGLVLEGGGMRGIYTAGVLDVFLQHGLCFDGVIGVSAGGIHGCSFLSGQAGRSIRYYKKYCADPRFMSLKSWRTTGNIVGVDFCYHELPDTLDPYDHAAFAACNTPFYVVCSNVETGKAEYLQVTDMREQIDYVRASASLPYFSHLVEIDGKHYLDGGCTDSIPVEAFRTMGYSRNVAVLTRHHGYRKKPGNTLLPRLFYRKYPAFAAALQNRCLHYNRTLDRIAELEQEGSLFVIRPHRELVVKKLEKDPAVLQHVYDMGREDALAQMPALQQWMKAE